MLFDSSIRKELARSFGATLVVLVTVVMTMMLIRSLGMATKGSVDPSDVMLVMGFTVLGQLPTILSLSLFIAIVGSVTRMYRDSEMVIWFSSGQGLSQWLRPLLRFSWPIMAAIAVLSLAIWPWSNQQVQQLRTLYEQRSDIDRIAPGEFQESSNGRRVFFIDKDSPDPTVASNVFVATIDPGVDSITSAQSARLTVIEGERYALLEKGSSTEVRTDAPGFRLSQFGEYGTRLGGSARLGEVENTNLRTMGTLALLERGSAPEMGEVTWRFGLVLAAFNFVLLALALASANPRASRNGNMMLALFAFVIYYNFLTLAQSWVGNGKLSILPMLLLLHGSGFALACLLLWARHHNWSWRDLIRRKQAA